MRMRIFRFYSLQQRLKLVTESSDWISAVKIRGMQQGTVYIAAEENARVTVIEKFTSGKKAQSDLAFRTKLYAGKNSTIRLVQINMLDEGQRLLNCSRFCLR